MTGNDKKYEAGCGKAGGACSCKTEKECAVC